MPFLPPNQQPQSTEGTYRFIHRPINKKISVDNKWHKNANTDMTDDSEKIFSQQPKQIGYPCDLQCLFDSD